MHWFTQEQKIKQIIKIFILNYIYIYLYILFENFDQKCKRT